MKARDRALVVLAALTLVAVAGSVQAADPGKDVVVTNTPANAVPVELQGMPTVNIGNKHPIIVDTGGKPFQAGSPSGMGIILPVGKPLFSTTVDVPAGKYLRIDHVGGLVVTSPSDSPDIQLQAGFEAGITQKYILPQGEGSRKPFGEDLTMFAGPGESIGITVHREDTSSEGLFRWALSGYLFEL